MNLNIWLTDLKAWYERGNHRDIDILRRGVHRVPDRVFMQLETPHDSEALAYWLDACQRLSIYYTDLGDADQGYNYLQFAYAKLQAMSTETSLQPDARRWALKKLDRLVVAMSDFCQHQHNEKWLEESKHLIDLHVAFMSGQNHLNLAYQQP
ncbi:hypothetical protein [Photobacterium sp. 1_MG-2023]|uniref:hypothetical protein n=1 Tax=Photobacterium sp. 1_MG-2023 TaxID=3062646 RepID=UPI0026E244DB|nr:hypothetical protein [Photobacterium sp. 1_MG-2023]MDO6706658.1 hypothetical protein [Photobacterium sp. 1_MG-2023]